MKDDDPASTRAKAAPEWESDSPSHLAAIAKWTKCIATLLVLILLFLAVISGVLLMQLRTRDCGTSRMNDVGGAREVADEDAFSATSGIHRVKRGLWAEEEESQPVETVVATSPTTNDAVTKAPNYDREAATEAILKEGFQNLTLQMDKILEKMETMPSFLTNWFSLINEKGKMTQTPKHMEGNLIRGTAELGNATQASVDNTDATDDATDIASSSARSVLPRTDTSFEADISNKLSSLTEIGSSISRTLDDLLDRNAGNDYRQPNFSCPHWNRGDYQHVGPTGYYSSCYYVQANV